MGLALVWHFQQRRGFPYLGELFPHVIFGLLEAGALLRFGLAAADAGCEGTEEASKHHKIAARELYQSANTDARAMLRLASIVLKHGDLTYAELPNLPVLERVLKIMSIDGY